MGIGFSTTQVSWATNCTGIENAGVLPGQLIGVFDATAIDGVVGTFPRGALNDCNAQGFNDDINIIIGQLKRGVDGPVVVNGIDASRFYTQPVDDATCVLKYRLQASEAAQLFWLAAPTFRFNQGADTCLATAFIEGVRTSGPTRVDDCLSASDPIISCQQNLQSALALGDRDTTFATFPVPGSGTGDCNNLFDLRLNSFYGDNEVATSGGFAVNTQFGEFNATDFAIFGNIRADAFYSTFENGECALKHRLSSAEVAELASWGGLTLYMAFRNPASIAYMMGGVSEPLDIYKFNIFAFPVTTTGVQTTGVQTTGVQTTGVQTTGVQTTGVQTTGVQTTGVQTTGVQTTGVQTTGVQTTGVQTTGVQTTGVQTTGVQTTGVQTTGVQTTGVQTTGVQTTGVATTGVATTGVPPTQCWTVFDCVDEANRGAGARASAGCVDGQCSAAACLNGFSKVQGSEQCTCTGFLDWAAEGGVRCAPVRECSEDWQCTQNGQFAVCASGTCGCKTGFTDVSGGSGQVDCQCTSGSQIDWTTGDAKCISLWSCGADWQCGNFNGYCNSGTCACKSGFVNVASAGSTFDCECQGSNFVSWVAGQPECLAPGECNYDWECASLDCNEVAGTCVSGSGK